MSDEPLIAVFVDFENLAIGAQQSKQGAFRIELVLKRLLEKGRIVFKRAYCDWNNYRKEEREFHKNGIRAEVCVIRDHAKLVLPDPRQCYVEFCVVPWPYRSPRADK